MAKSCVLAGVLCALVACASAPPVQEMSDARQAISAAEHANARVHAEQQLSQAEGLLDQAEKFIRTRQYSSARRDAIASRAKAVEARRISEENLDFRGYQY